MDRLTKIERLEVQTPSPKDDGRGFHDLERERYQSDTEDRKELKTWVKMVINRWLIATITILGLVALDIKVNFPCLKWSISLAFHLSDPVLCVFLGTATINILGLPFIVLKGYFNPR